MAYELRSGKVGEGYTPYGAVREFMLCHDAEAIIAGPAETGKTLGGLWKLHICACKYPGAQLAIVRKTQQSLYGTVLQTYEKRVLGKDAPVVIFGGAKPEWYDYANGSRIYTGGMDNPNKVLSAERDIIYVNQAEELMPADWETLTTRTTGRAGNMPYNQCIGDCNPAQPKHWIIERSNAGKLKLFTSVHQDNPTLYDLSKGDWTEQGVKTLERLGSLTEPRRSRLLLGQWVQVEGLVYEEFSRAEHVRDNAGPFRDVIAGVDEGYTNPAVILVIGFDGDGRAHVISEYYQRRVLQGDVVGAARELMQTHKISAFYADPSAAGLMAEMSSVGLPVMAATNDVMPGIQAVKSYLAKAGDGRPRLTIAPGCVNTIAEFESYQWKQGRAGMKDEPEKVNDHSADALRYALMSMANNAPALIEL